MKKITLIILSLISVLAWAGGDPNPAEYAINVHVSSSRLVTGSAPGFWQKLDVVINGKKYELESTENNFLLALGDYQAKLVKDEHKTSYDSLQTYEFLFPDKKTRKFEVVGQME